MVPAFSLSPPSSSDGSSSKWNYLIYVVLYFFGWLTAFYMYKDHDQNMAEAEFERKLIYIVADNNNAAQRNEILKLLLDSDLIKDKEGKIRATLDNGDSANTPSPASGNKSYIAGMVLNQEDEPITGVSIEIGKNFTDSDEYGFFSLVKPHISGAERVVVRRSGNIIYDENHIIGKDTLNVIHLVLPI